MASSTAAPTLGLAECLAKNLNLRLEIIASIARSRQWENVAAKLSITRPTVITVDWIHDIRAVAQNQRDASELFLNKAIGTGATINELATALRQAGLEDVGHQLLTGAAIMKGG